MSKKNFENWWSENLFGEKTEYMHLGNTIKMPSIDEFSETWMGSINQKDRIKVRKNFKKYKTLLDVGCGGSPEYYGIKKYKNLTYTGIDITPEMVQFNKEKGINCIEGSANNIPFEDSTFDVVHTRHVLEHMENFIKPIDEMIRVSNKLVLISFFIELLEHGESKYSLDNEGTEYEIFHNQYSKDDINRVLHKNQKVKKFKYTTLPDPSKTLLKILLN
jgi:ubiquinone/menaquinone biosynthesis C-methylase UbiE